MLLNTLTLSIPAGQSTVDTEVYVGTGKIPVVFAVFPTLTATQLTLSFLIPGTTHAYASWGPFAPSPSVLTTLKASASSLAQDIPVDSVSGNLAKIRWAGNANEASTRTVTLHVFVEED